ncbi:ABC transporter ATP-binding protein [Polaromonas eurypsychrophila]|uniref:ABC transporter ATP-binding protein n=1 Tax=Polaromonas eurypsychrophila TaxID=1614635 RepID=A0A916SFL7_9BURK|nr:ABC transporter ATP-binding protein [Polaromonas eurypsychrophila]GGA97812.1 ABC transporter ATP-binding protein [Polaromonas eurypsychrophila]
MLEIKSISSSYGEARILHAINLTVAQGQVVGLLGRNGTGKTTLIRSIMQVKPPQVTSGSIKWNGRELCGMSSNEVALLGIGLVPQGRRLFASLTVQEHLEIVPRRPAVSGRRPWTVERAYELFPRLGERRSHRGNQLSGGERQMLAITRALMLNPDLMLMDEPTEGLAPLIVQHVEQAVSALKAEGLTVLLVEQNLRSALAVVDSVYILETGAVVHHGSASDLTSDAATLHRYLGV